MLQFHCGKGSDFAYMNYNTCFLVAIVGDSMFIQNICISLPDCMLSSWRNHNIYQLL
jgi:hypothetical protein